MTFGRRGQCGAGERSGERAEQRAQTEQERRPEHAADDSADDGGDLHASRRTFRAGGERGREQLQELRGRGQTDEPGDGHPVDAHEVGGPAVQKAEADDDERTGQADDERGQRNQAADEQQGDAGDMERGIEHGTAEVIVAPRGGVQIATGEAPGAVVRVSVAAVGVGREVDEGGSVACLGLGTVGGGVSRASVAAANRQRQQVLGQRRVEHGAEALARFPAAGRWCGRCRGNGPMKA